MSKSSFILQYRPMGSPFWGDATTFPNRVMAIQHFGMIDDLLSRYGELEVESAGIKITDGDDVRVVIRFEPCANAPIDAVCQYNMGRGTGCEADAVVDTPLFGSRWGYLCADHWAAVGSQSPGLVNVISEVPQDFAIAEL